MGLHLPAQLDWVGYIAGSPWPDEDEDDYWGIADDWSTARERLHALLPGGSAQPSLDTATAATRQAYPVGDGGDALTAALHRLAAGAGSLDDLVGHMSLVVDVANITGSKIRELKLMIATSLVLLAWELATSSLYPPTAPMADAEDIGRTRIYLQWLLRQARLDIERTCEPLLNVVRAGRRLLTHVAEPVTGAVERVGAAMYDAIDDLAGRTVADAVSYFPKLGWEKAPATMKFVAAQDIIAQADPVVAQRSAFNTGELGVSLLAAVSGTTFAAVPVGNLTGAAADRLLGSFGADTSRGLAGGVRGMVAGAVGNESSTLLSNAVFDLATTGTVHPGDWSAQGLVSGFSRSMMTGFTRGAIGELGAAPGSAGAPPEPRTTTIRTAAGELVTTAIDADGGTTVTTHAPDAAGTPTASTTVGPDGAVTTRSRDGIIRTSRGGYTTTTHDGTTRTSAPDGSVTTTTADGTRVTERFGATTATAEGDITTTTTVGDRLTVRASDGSVTTTHHHDGAVTATRTTADGLTVTSHPDGAFTITDPASHTTVESAPSPTNFGPSHFVDTQSPPADGPDGAAVPPRGGVHLTHNVDEPHNGDLLHQEPLAPDEHQARRRDRWHTLQQQRLHAAQDTLAEHRHTETEHLAAAHDKQQQRVDPTRRAELSAAQQAEREQLVDRHHAEQDNLDHAQQCEVRKPQPREGSAMRAKKRPKELAAHYHWPAGVIAPQAAPPLAGPPTPHRTPTLPGPTPDPPVHHRQYVVQTSDTLSAIAARYGINWETLYSINRAVIGDDADRLLPGQELTLPTGSR